MKREEGLTYKTHGGEAIEMSILRAALGRHLAGDGELGGGGALSSGCSCRSPITLPENIILEEKKLN